LRLKRRIIVGFFDLRPRQTLRQLTI
jgi:hypothetical protein